MKMVFRVKSFKMANNFSKKLAIFAVYHHTQVFVPFFFTGKKNTLTWPVKRNIKTQIISFYFQGKFEKMFSLSTEYVNVGKIGAH